MFSMHQILNSMLLEVIQSFCYCFFSEEEALFTRTAKLSLLRSRLRRRLHQLTKSQTHNTNCRTFQVQSIVQSHATKNTSFKIFANIPPIPLLLRHLLFFFCMRTMKIFKDRVKYWGTLLSLALRCCHLYRWLISNVTIRSSLTCVH